MSINIKLEKMVEEILEGKKTRDNKDVELKESEGKTIRQMDRNIHGGKIKTTEEVLDVLEKMETVRNYLDRNDLRDLEEKIKKVLKA
ncbi:MAG: hypothetical protein WCJ51_02865 [Candidatus Moraniibacteriota bacterium]